MYLAVRHVEGPNEVVGVTDSAGKTRIAVVWTGKSIEKRVVKEDMVSIRERRVRLAKSLAFTA